MTEFADIVLDTDLEALDLDGLTALCTRLSAMRAAAGGQLKVAITTYAVEVNLWVSRRAREREQALSRARELAPELAARHQRVSAKSFEGRIDQVFITRIEELIRRQGVR